MITVGQIELDHPLGHFLAEQASKARSIIEIGTGSGLGSTRCLAEGLQQGAHLSTLEGFYEQHRIARTNIDNWRGSKAVYYYYGILHRMILPYKHPQDNPQIRECWEHERTLTDIGPIVEFNDPIDLLFLDGGEFTSTADFLLLWHRARVIVLDDCNPEKAVKNVAALHFMHGNPLFAPIRIELQERNGWAAYRRI